MPSNDLTSLNPFQAPVIWLEDYKPCTPGALLDIIRFQYEDLLETVREAPAQARAVRLDTPQKRNSFLRGEFGEDAYLLPDVGPLWAAALAMEPNVPNWTKEAEDANGTLQQFRDLVNALAAHLVPGPHSSDGDPRGREREGLKTMSKRGRRKIDWPMKEDEARRYLWTHRRRPNQVTVRELAKNLGISAAKVCELDAWQQEMDRRGRRDKHPQPRAVSLTGAEASTDDGELERLIAESKAEADKDPSPLEPGRQKVKAHKRV